MLFRAELEVPVQVTTKDRRSFSAQARKLSVGGLGLRNVSLTDKNPDELTFQLTLPGTGELVKAKGLVAWSDSNAMAGIRSTEISRPTAELLRAWIGNNDKHKLPTDPASRYREEQKGSPRPWRRSFSAW